MQPRSVLLVGGSGFIGSHVAARLADAGVTVLLPTRRHQRARHLSVLPTVQLLEMDVFDPIALDRVLPQVDAVINLVGVLHSSTAKPWGPQFERAHVSLPRLLAAACQRHGVKRFVQMSALGASSDAPSMYLRSKAAGEAVLQQAGLDLTVLRPSVVFGPEDKFLNLFATLQKFMPVLALGGLDAKFQPVYVGDVAQAFVNALQDPSTVGATYELVGPHIYTLRDLVQLAGRYSGHPRPLLGLPAPLGRLQAWLLEYVPGGPLMSRDNLDSMRVDNVASVSYSAPPHWAPTPLEAIAPEYLAAR